MDVCDRHPTDDCKPADAVKGEAAIGPLEEDDSERHRDGGEAWHGAAGEGWAAVSSEGVEGSQGGDDPADDARDGAAPARHGGPEAAGTLHSELEVVFKAGLRGVGVRKGG